MSSPFFVDGEGGGAREKTKKYRRENSFNRNIKYDTLINKREFFIDYGMDSTLFNCPAMR